MVDGHTPAHDAAEFDALIRLEEELSRTSRDDLHDGEYHAARRATSALLGAIGEISFEHASLPDAIDAAANFSNKSATRKAALVVLRIAYRVNLLPEPTSSNRLKIRVTKLIEQGVPDLLPKFGVEPNMQTYEKYDKIATIHGAMCERLEPLRQFSAKTPTVGQLLASRAEVIKIVSMDVLNAYLTMYGLKRIKSVLIQILTDIAALSKTTDASFATLLNSLNSVVESEITAADSSSLFLQKDYYLPYLLAVRDTLKQLGEDAKDRFFCSIAPKRMGSDVAEKRYPLHETGRLITATVMLLNAGPGVARDVKIKIVCQSECAEADPLIEMTEIPPGDCVLCFDVLIAAPTSELKFELNLSWAITGESERFTKTCSIKLIAQNANVDWTKARKIQPYSTDVAEGEDFVGRKIKVQTIAGRFTRERMGSSFITGQKRVGKTSLARAVENKIADESPDVYLLYLEYGQYTSMDPVETLRNLGSELSEFLLSHLSNEAPKPIANFQGSLAPISKIADALYRESPAKKFIFILDEFDEIDPDLYRYGALAESFFSSLRTLSAKRNVAFLLVGGEKMPFVMSAQGDQLNKFISERLDYFDKSEWADFVELIRKPVAEDINWSDAALQRIFEFSNGHPYYTKLICAQAFKKAVNEKDAEITEADVSAAVRELISELDSNSFAHLWKDGIPESDRQKSEVFELNRRRVLCACARTLRQKEFLTHETVAANRSGLQIDAGHVGGTLMDFARRGVLVERNSTFDFSIPLFRIWLEEVGTSRLMADVLSEEYESKEQELEESARISSSEISAIASKWNSYRGQLIGEERVRAWLEQVPTNQEQRILFKILENLRFVSHTEVRELLVQAHRMLAQYLPTFYQEKKSDRRRDIAVTWLDGPGKSGNIFAGLYAEENRISTTFVTSPEGLAKRFSTSDTTKPAVVIIVDDFIGTGNSLAENIKSFLDLNGAALKANQTKLLVVALIATAEGEAFLRDKLTRLNCDAELRICETIASRHMSFPKVGFGFWGSAEEYGKAQELCQRWGSKIHRQSPLGYGDQGLLLSFQNTCPNNTLPVLHGGTTNWRPLFERPKN